MRLTDLVYLLTDYRPDLPEGVVLDCLQEAARLLSVHGLCLRTTVRITQPAGTPYVAPFVSPDRRVPVRILAIRKDGSWLTPTDTLGIQDAQSPARIAEGDPSRFIPLQSGLALMDMKLATASEMDVLVAYAYDRQEDELAISVTDEEALLEGAKWKLLSRPGKGCQPQMAIMHQRSFQAYVGGARVQAAYGLTPGDWMNMLQAPGVMEIPAPAPDPTPDPDPNPAWSLLTFDLVPTLAVDQSDNFYDEYEIRADWTANAAGPTTVTVGTLTEGTPITEQEFVLNGTSGSIVLHTSFLLHQGGFQANVYPVPFDGKPPIISASLPAFGGG